MACCWTTAILGIVIALLVLTNISRHVRRYVKFTIFAGFSIFVTTISIPVMLLNPRSSKNALFPAAALRFVAKHVLGLECSVKGKENIVEEGGAVVLINHQSCLDLIVLAELWPVMERSTVISKKEIFYIWPFGLAAWLWGTIFIDRISGTKARDAINSTGAIIKNRQAKVLMFPEGTRSDLPKLLSFKKGAFHLALASGCPLQPVVVSRYGFLGAGRFDCGKIEIDILPAIETADYSKDKLQELIDRTYNIMQDHLDGMSSPNNNVEKPKSD